MQFVNFIAMKKKKFLNFIFFFSYVVYRKRGVRKQHNYDNTGSYKFNLKY